MVKILLAEDNELNRDMLMRRLERRGYQVDIAMDGEEAIEKVRSHGPDLLLLDISLPILDGFEVARRIREDPQLCALPILGLSAHAMQGDRERALAAGCDDYDTKPVEMERLLDKIQLLLQAATRP
ncbi:signal transduction response regulator [Sulfuriferula multivorans]|uniref:Signal transduction response regulator n=1 Tax=Sulfuriferula multivorans TaxID=1559896 RepID=A0A401JYL4_9PROT|nr:response regulator [Sulfuriferula multivorans]GCB01963.1 signal transduction response regulator [Sulfuriferula multivorans]